jgi:hypothetical protein
LTIVSVTNTNVFAAKTNHSLIARNVAMPVTIHCTAARDRVMNRANVSGLERCCLIWPALLWIASGLVSMPAPGFGALKAHLFAIPTNLFQPKASACAAESASFVTPAAVGVTDRSFFAAPTFFIAT